MRNRFFPTRFNHHEILLRMRAYYRRRTAVLQFLRTELWRQTLSETPRESATRRGMLPMRKPRSFAAAAQGAFCMAATRLARLRPFRACARFSIRFDWAAGFGRSYRPFENLWALALDRSVPDARLVSLVPASDLPAANDLSSS